MRSGRVDNSNDSTYQNLDLSLKQEAFDKHTSQNITCGFILPAKSLETYNIKIEYLYSCLLCNTPPKRLTKLLPTFQRNTTENGVT